MATAKKQKYYVVWEGRETGVYDNWAEAKTQIDGYLKARYKSFTTAEEAYEAFAKGADGYKRAQIADTRPEKRSIAVDAACSGNPGVMEYRAVAVWNGDQIFHKKFPFGTNNIGEFLAIVHALALLKAKNHTDMIIYSDSQIAIKWVRAGVCKTKLEYSPKTAELFDVIKRAEIWLANNTIENRIEKWHTEVWGEIPADFGRK
ncbi:MAG: ribonuclease H family protein [Bacteroidales bacterium]|nr:ribonuclease H family protein [Bacteroidales bacterium]